MRDGSNVRDWLYVDDHVDAVWTILCRGRSGETYNVGGNNEWTNLDLLYKRIDVVAELTGDDADDLRKLITFVKDRPGHDQCYAIGASKLKRELGWEPRHELDAGLRQTVQLYRENPGWIECVRSGAYRDWIDKHYGDPVGG